MDYHPAVDHEQKKGKPWRTPRMTARDKPSKPHRSFPLTAHNNGQWCKKIRGKIHFFGVWKDPEEALNRYLRAAADLHAGRRPTENLHPDTPTVKVACNEYLTYQQERLDVGEISPCPYRKPHPGKKQRSGLFDGEAGSHDRRMYGVVGDATSAWRGLNSGLGAWPFRRPDGTGPMQDRHAARV